MLIYPVKGLAEWTTHSSPLQNMHRSSPTHASAHSPIIKSSPVPDTTSTVYPERMIRPLPKRRLRDRLSEEQSKALEVPIIPQRNAPLFSFPFPFPDDNSQNADKGDENSRDANFGKSEERRQKSPPPPPPPPPPPHTALDHVLSPLFLGSGGGGDVAMTAAAVPDLA